MTTKKDALAPAQDAAMAPAGDMTHLMEVALQSGNVDALERLVALQERVEARNAARTFHRELAAAKAEFPEIKKTYGGPHSTKVGGITKGNYAPLDEIRRAVEPALTRHGFSFRWDREPGEPGQVTIVCVLSHEDGHSESSRFFGVPDDGGKKNAIQQIASGSSYGYRYSLIQVLGLTTVDPDDDAERAMERAPDMSGAKITPEDAEKIRARLAAINRTEYAFLEYVSKVWGCTEPIMHLEDIPATHLDDAWRVKGMR